MTDSSLNAGPPTGKDGWAHPSVLLVATDLSDLDRLMPFALEQAVETKARLILLHVLAPSIPVSANVVGLPYCDPGGGLDLAGQTLSPWCELACRQNIDCDAVVREGHAARQIEDAVREFQADRVLLGTRSRSKLGKLLLGSVAEQVLRSVNLPVITVGPEAHLPVAGGDVKRVVLHATTLRETSRPSAALACRIAASQGATLVLLHVLPPLDEQSELTVEAASLQDWTMRPCMNSAFLPARPAPAAAQRWRRMSCTATRPSKFFPRLRNAGQP